MKIKITLFVLSLGFLTFSCKSSAELAQKYETAQQNLDNCQEKAQRYAAKTEELGRESESYRDKMNEMQQEYSQMRNKLSETEAALESVTRELQATSDNYGTWFRVQIGAFEDPKIDNDLETNEEGMGLENANDMQKIVIGRFRDYQKAKQLQTQMKTLGIQDAWIASYEDGVRVPIEQVIGN
ncbi:MAG: SPOR domain-containing protein [Phaeodactylibacter sp.]|uniref:SPOR domain-containing protein n=1 Tax=Phaeodactylibacter sp. TaxID=1940289 RepID=UPI0032ECBCC9